MKGQSFMHNGQIIGAGVQSQKAREGVQVLFSIGY
jgi:hypothetical protein